MHIGKTIYPINNQNSKAYKTKEGKILLFRPDKNAERANNTNRRICIPEIPDEDFVTPDVPAIDDTPAVDDKPIDITPPSVKDESSGSDNGIDLAKAIGISIGAGAAVGAAALGAHTVKKAKENNIYEDE